ncbi:TPA: hypothetical protein ACIAIE_001264 [Serratia fonticola]
MKISINDLPKWPSPSPEKKILKDVFDRADWIAFLNSLSTPLSVTDDLKEAFHLIWIEKGHFIRNQLNDDTQLLLLLKFLLPTYTGTGRIVYRGENLARFEAREVGFSWTTEKDEATNFASGLNSYKYGGILLEAYAPPQAILAGVHPHSIYLGEYEITVDASMLKGIKEIKRFNPSH